MEELIEKLKEKNPKIDVQLLKKAVSFLEKCPTEFQNRKRETHLLNTAAIIAEEEFDEETIIAGLLHHLLRNKESSKEKIEKDFGKEVAELVEGIDKIDSIEAKNKDSVEPEILSKLILATAKDIRMIFVRLAARLESMRALEYLPEQLQKETAQNTLDIYVPICHKLGLHKIRWELEDLAMKKLDPQAYGKIKKEIKQTREERERQIAEIAKDMEKTLQGEKIECRVYGRAKNFYRINKKMMQQNKKFSEITDLQAARVICNSENECYEALARLQQQYPMLQNNFDDYMARPKPNGYRSIHACFKINNNPTEVQIRTWEMHNNAEDGLAAHWQYKQYKKDKHFDPQLSIAKQLTEWQRTAKNTNELIETMRLRFEGGKVFVFTPKNQLIELDDGATPIDFAFAVHSDLGSKCEKAKANGKIVPLDYKLQNGDTVEIMTSEKQTPNRQWLSFVKTEKAKQRIRQACEIQLTAKPKQNIIQKIRGIIELSRKAKEKTRAAKCCNPLPGDKIVGIKTTKRKIIIHRTDCKNIEGIPESKKIRVSEELFEKGNYDVVIKIDAENRPGMLPEILNKMSESNAAINATNAKLLPNNTITCLLNIKIKTLSDLEKVLEKTRKTKGVKRAERA